MKSLRLLTLLKDPEKLRAWAKKCGIEDRVERTIKAAEEQKKKKGVK